MYYSGEQQFYAVLRAENDVIAQLLPEIELPQSQQGVVIARAHALITAIRGDNKFGVEDFVQQFSLATQEGVAVMCLAEALLRIPDRNSAIEFVIDKLSNKSWWHYLTRSKSMKAAFAAYGLCVSGVFADLSDTSNELVALISRVGQPLFLLILRRAIQFLGKEFVFAQDVPSALNTIRAYPQYRFAFDLLGESARTLEQGEKYFAQYLQAIETISSATSGHDADDIYQRLNLSVKFTALYPRFEWAKKDDIENHLLPKLITLVEKIKEHNLTITFDAEEASRLDIYLHIVTRILRHKTLKDFAGIGLVVQAYQTRAYEVLDYVIAIAQDLGHKIPVRLVKGAYWDLEIKHAQEYGLNFYPVFTNKEYTDVSYIACAKKMLANDTYIFSQFATHNALTAATIIELGQNKQFELQKLHGMGRVLHDKLVQNHPVRIYAPIGQMNDLLAYLMRRMLENGANSCFVNKVKNDHIAADRLAYNLYDLAKHIYDSGKKFTLPQDIFLDRKLPLTYDLGYMIDYTNIQQQVSSFYQKTYQAHSIIDGNAVVSDIISVRYRPAQFATKFADISIATTGDIQKAVSSAAGAFNGWANQTIVHRADILRKIADLYEENKYYLYALLIQEAGKTIADATAEVTEAIDFCRYYANLAEKLFTPINLPSPTGESNVLTLHPRGVFLCISPWNFPLAIFTGQIVAALVCGNSAIAKPAEQTCVIATAAVKLMHKAGIPSQVLQLVITSGSEISKHVVSDERVVGVVFTGSTATARLINISLAARTSGIVPFIAETGGQNAMIVDSSALLEQVTDDALNSAFGSAGQRCSALRMLYIQEEIYEPLIEMLVGAMKMLKIADPTDFSTDIGPVIDKASQENLLQHVDAMQNKGFKLIATHPQIAQAQDGYFFYPHIIEVNSINDIPDEKFGPILHVAKYKSSELDIVLDAINDCGYGLTFGVHSRINSRIDYISSKIRVGNIYANRSMIGAKVESQPFGGENKSGTGFKAGGPHYLLKFITERTKTVNLTAIGGNVELLNEI